MLVIMVSTRALWRRRRSKNLIGCGLNVGGLPAQVVRHGCQVDGCSLDLGSGVDKQLADVFNDRLNLVDDVDHRGPEVCDLFAHGACGFAQDDEDGQQGDGLQQHGQRDGGNNDELNGLTIEIWHGIGLAPGIRGLVSPRYDNTLPRAAGAILRRSRRESRTEATRAVRPRQER